MTLTLAVSLVACLLAADVGSVVGWARVRTRLDLRPDGSRPLPLPAVVASALDRAAVPRVWWSRWVGATASVGVVAVIVPGLRLLALALVAGPVAALAMSGDRAARRRRRQLPEALDRVAAGLRGGASLPAALGTAAAAVGPPLVAELEQVTAGVDAGEPLAAALERWASPAPDGHTALAAAALSVAAEVGGPGARSVEGAAASLRDRLAADAEAGALATQGRASAVVLTLAPVGFAVLLTGIDPEAGRFLLSTPVGWLCLAAGITLDACGAWWMSRLVRSAR